MQVKSIAECSKGSILQYFWPSLSHLLSLRFLFCLFLSVCWRQVLLYLMFQPKYRLKGHWFEPQWRHCVVSLFCLFDLILYVPVSNFSVMSGRVFLGWNSTKQGFMCLAQGHKCSDAGEVICSWARHLILCLVLVQSMKHADMTEHLLTVKVLITTQNTCFNEWTGQ